MYYWFASTDKESGYARKAFCNCRICANHRNLSSSGRAVSVSQSLSGLRSSQSPPHGCCQ